MEIETFVVDAFTDQAFKGNPAGVCLEKEALTDELRLNIAKELGYSETAFLRESAKVGHFTIRYFSPVMEIPLCGHATLASSKVLFSCHPSYDKLEFQTIEGLNLLVRRNGKAISMRFPVYDTIPQEVPGTLLDALGLKTIENSAFNREMKILMLEIRNPEALEQLSPDFDRLLASHDSINGVLITAPSKRESFDFESRYFWPWSGTNEDPVTGATHCFLTKYWSERLGKNKMRSFQCSSRTGFMDLTLVGQEELIIDGQARIILQGKLTI